MSAIPSSLTRAHVERAVQRIDRNGVPPRRGATKFHLLLNGRRYPPKYVLSLAAAEATGRELRPDEFSGGTEANHALQKLGFTIIGPGLPEPRTQSGPTTSPRSLQKVAPKRSRSARPTQPDAPPARRRAEGEPLIVRVVVDGEPASSPEAASEVLLEAFESWPTPGRTKFAITPGGFVVGDFPATWRGGLGWASTPKDLDDLIRFAHPVVESCVTKAVLSAAKRRTQFLTIGVDLIDRPSEPHAELVAVVECSSGKIVRWTGKSYPTGYQESMLVQVADLKSHFLDIAGERVLVLGCHDLNMFSARARANQNPEGVRRQRCDAMARATARFRPTVVLQHPHSTDTPNTWRMPWACLVRDYPSVRSYASGIGYFRWDDDVRRPLDDVLRATRSEGRVADVIVGTENH